jgi:hypothetical protein
MNERANCNSVEVSTGSDSDRSDWSATVSVAVTLEKAFASEDACAPVAALFVARISGLLACYPVATAPGTDCMPACLTDCW